MTKSNKKNSLSTSGVWFEVRDVDPSVAAAWLAKPWVRQRTVSHAVVRKYARAMADGRWEEPSLDPIGFTPDGDLGNGQHRLSAVIESGWRGEMLVAMNVPPENFLVHDTGRKRQASQFVKLPNASLIVAMTRVVLWYDRLHPTPLNGTNATSFDNDEVLEYVDANEDLIVQCARDADFAYRNAGIPSTPHAAVLFVARRGEVDEDRVSTWLDGISTGVGLGPGDPRLRLREYFIRHPNVRRDRATTWAVVVRAFNAFLEGRTLSKIMALSPGDQVPVVRYAGKSQKKTNPQRRNAAQIEAARRNIAAANAALERRRRPDTSVRSMSAR